MSSSVIGVVILVAILAIILMASSLRVVQEYERGVIFRLGRCVGAKGPGIFLIVPILDKIVKTNLQINAVSVAPQQVITRDNVTVTVDAVAYMQVVDAAASVVRVRDWFSASQLVAQTTLRSIVGRHELDQMLAERERLNAELASALDEQTEHWGVKVQRVEIRDVVLPDQMQRAMARQAEAERERRAKIVAAEGELQASEKISQAAAIIRQSPGALQLRQLQTMVEISAENNSTIIFPIPMEILEAVQSFRDLELAQVQQITAAAATPTPPLPPSDPV
ncbi:MAG: slipin family protein [Acidimicrobiia bacterium]|nr:slipin family protein [Acidimicrobiia bacterium]